MSTKSEARGLACALARARAPAPLCCPESPFVKIQVISNNAQPFTKRMQEVTVRSTEKIVRCWVCCTLKVK